MVSISEFKQAFASGGTNDPLKKRGQQVEAALLRLKTAVARAGGANGANGGFQAALVKLVERFAAVQKHAGGKKQCDPAAELDEIHRQTQIVTARLEAAPDVAAPPPTEAQAVPTGTRFKGTLDADLTGYGLHLDPIKGDAGPKGGGNSTEELDIQFTVNVEYTDVPVVGAKITVGDRSGTTDSKGELTLQRTKQPHPLTVTAKGFKELKGTLDADLTGYGLHLDPIKGDAGPKGGGNSTEELDIQFTVNVEYTDVPVVGAKITVGDRSGTTDSKGELTLQRTKQPHPLTVTAKGFKELKGTLDADLTGYGLHLDPINGNSGTRE